MTKLEEMSHEEIAALTEEEISNFVDLECAEKGITIAEKPVKPDVLEVDDKPDQEVYEVAGLTFSESGPAAEVATLIKEHQGFLVKNNYDWSVAGGNTHYVDDFDDKIEVAPTRILSWKKFQAIRGDLTLAHETRGAFDKELAAWKGAHTKRADIRKKILAVIRKHKEAEADYQRYHKVLARYVELSEGNKQVARKFFEEAHKDDEKAQALKPRLYGEFGIMVVEDGRLVRGETVAQAVG